MIIVVSDDSMIKVVDDNKNLNIFAKDTNKKLKKKRVLLYPHKSLFIVNVFFSFICFFFLIQFLHSKFRFIRN